MIYDLLLLTPTSSLDAELKSKQDKQGEKLLKSHQWVGRRGFRFYTGTDCSEEPDLTMSCT